MSPEEYERQDIEILNEVRPYCFESDREEQWFKVGLQYGLDASDAEPLSRWISVKDDLPCNHMELLEGLRYTKMVEVVFQDKGSGKRRVEVRQMINIKTNFNSSNEWMWKAYWFEDIIYWRPIPEPPKD